MRLHKEGRTTLIVVAVFILIVNFLVIKITQSIWFVYPTLFISILLYIFIRHFFRVPNRMAINDEMAIISPCDGEVVVIENCMEDEYFHEERKQISIFMSAFNVHINWFPVSGKVIFSTIQRGSHVVAWAPKSSTHNERSTVVFETKDKHQILIRQIAGAVARRVVCYAKKDDEIEQNDELGFIKFGSRVDLFIPVDYEIKVDINQKVTGSQTVIARIKR